MDKEVIDWLLEGPVWLRYAVERQLLDAEPDVKPVLQDDSIIRIVQRLKDGQVGLPALKARRITYTDAGNAYWDLFFLADIGLSIDDLKLKNEIEGILSLQSPGGTYITERAMEPNYFCQSAILLSSIAMMGYWDDPWINKYIQAILNSRRPDGGWHCEDWYTESCPMDDMNILRLLGQYDKYRRDPRFNGGIDLLLEHWERRDRGWRLSLFGTGKRYRSLMYPAVKYGILRVLDVLSLFPYAAGREGFQSMLDFVHRKSSGGRYYAESVDEAYAGFDFGQQKEPSRWLTFLVNRIEKRAY